MSEPIYLECLNEFADDEITRAKTEEKPLSLLEIEDPEFYELFWSSVPPVYCEVWEKRAWRGATHITWMDNPTRLKPNAYPLRDMPLEPQETKPDKWEVCEVINSNGVLFVDLPKWHPRVGVSVAVGLVAQPDGIFGGYQFEGQRELEDWHMTPKLIREEDGELLDYDYPELHVGGIMKPAKAVRVRFMRPESEE